MPTLNWIGRKAVENHHRQVPFHLLKDVPDLSVGDPGGGNLLVEGDNLLALKALLPYYGGQVKCVYIDPPYNTGNEGWIYNDNVNSPEMREWLGRVVGKESDDLTRHDKWLCMMYPRLVLLREMLREDGAIFVSIDDNEVHNLKYLLDEVFDNQNFLATLIWEKGKKGDSKFFSETHEYILAYARSKKTLLAGGTVWKRQKAGVERVLDQYKHFRQRLNDDHLAIRQEMMKWYRGLKKGDPAKAHKHYNWSDDRGLYFPDNFHGPDDGRDSRPRYDIIHPKSGLPCKKPSTGWRWEESRTQAALKEIPPLIHFGPDETTIPCRKSYLVDASREAFTTVFYKDGRAATLAVETLVGKGKFSFPKDAEILSGIFRMVTNPGDLILDSFAGSGTTGHAVMQLNKEDGGNRRFIMVEMDPNICRNVTAERVKRVSEGYTNGGGKPVEGLGSGFRFATLGDALFDERGNIRNTVRFGDLARHVYFVETGEPLPRGRVPNSPLIGVHRGKGIYLLYNGILKDKSPDGGNVLTTPVLSALPEHNGPKVIYGTACRLGAARLRHEGISFKQLPYKIKVDAP
jgi:adenine-specific DNA-methyltransferase